MSYKIEITIDCNYKQKSPNSGNFLSITQILIIAFLFTSKAQFHHETCLKILEKKIPLTQFPIEFKIQKKRKKKKGRSFINKKKN